MLLGADAALTAAAVKNAAGEVLAVSYQWSFTTGVLQLTTLQTGSLRPASHQNPRARTREAVLCSLSFSRTAQRPCRDRCRDAALSLLPRTKTLAQALAKAVGSFSSARTTQPRCGAAAGAPLSSVCQPRDPRRRARPGSRPPASGHLIFCIFPGRLFLHDFLHQQGRGNMFSLR